VIANNNMFVEVEINKKTSAPLRLRGEKISAGVSNEI